MLRFSLWIPFAWLISLPCWAGDGKPSPQAIQFFETKVRPVLAENCFKCHGSDKQKGGLRLDSRVAILKGGDQGPVIVAGQPAQSLLIKAIGYEDEPKMPPSKKLPKELIADLTQWVKMGAPWPAADHAPAAAAVRRGEFQLTARDRAHWAFQPVKRPALPLKNASVAANPIDAFIIARLETQGLQPNPPASKRELIRRVYYDVIGLPPTPNEVDAFLADSSPLAYEHLVDRLLSSPHYGEKWGRHWLDLVRFAETNSYERDNPKPNAWRYRDYVIRSFNDDKPYDQFLREQLAGDELPDGGLDALIATGYYRLGIWDDEPSDPAQARYDSLDDIVATTGQVFLGLTFDCARCHDHKIDPIPQKDYYRLLSFFHNINYYRNGGPTDEVPLLADSRARQEYEQRAKQLQEKRTRIQVEVAGIENDFRIRHDQRSEIPLGPTATPKDIRRYISKEGAELLGQARYDRYRELLRELASLKGERLPAETALAVTEAGRDAPETFVLLRGNPQVKGDRVEPAFPQILGGSPASIPPTGPDARTTGRRLVLANWIASDQNPLTARVMVNRIWQYHFGRGIVRSPNNFGLQGDKPTHPELLDWLASEFMAQGWCLKSLHRLILTSNAYRMSSHTNPKAIAADSPNDLLWSMDMRRLSAEEIRDSILAANGTLNSKMYGPGIYPEIPAEVMAGQSRPGYGWGKSPPEEQARRSVYIHVKRSLLTPLLESFDLAETDRSTPVRFTSIQPTQALGMLNSDFLNRQAVLFAARIRKETGDDSRKQVRLAWRLVAGRLPNDEEVQRDMNLIDAFKTRDGVAAEVALKYYCLMLLNLNEFVYLE
jgi:hypothetical protein